MPWSMIKECVSFAHFVVPEWKGNTSLLMGLVILVVSWFGSAFCLDSLVHNKEF